MAMMTKCAECGGPLPDRASTGRPARYCTLGCRRAAEYRVTMTKRQIERLRPQLSGVRIEDAVEGDYGNPARRRRHMDALNEEIRVAEARLRDLFNEADEA